MNPLNIDRRPAGLFLSVWLVRRTARNPIARHYATPLGETPLHVLTIGARFAVVILWQRPAPDATATAGANRSGARP